MACEKPFSSYGNLISLCGDLFHLMRSPFSSYGGPFHHVWGGFFSFWRVFFTMYVFYLLFLGLPHTLHFFWRKPMIDRNLLETIKKLQFALTILINKFLLLTYITKKYFTLISKNCKLCILFYLFIKHLYRALFTNKYALIRWKI